MGNSLEIASKGLKELPKDLANDLEELDCSKNAVISLEPLKRCLKLKKLVAPGNKIATLIPLADLRELVLIDVSANSITALPDVMSRLTNLTEFRCDDNRISDLQPLMRLGKLEVLRCRNNLIADLFPLASLANLKVLRCNGNSVAKLDPLANLVKLEELFVAQNQITTLLPIARLPRLHILSCANNPLDNLLVLAALGSLRDMQCSDDQLGFIELKQQRKDLTIDIKHAADAAPVVAGNFPERAEAAPTSLLAGLLEPRGRKFTDSPLPLSAIGPTPPSSPHAPDSPASSPTLAPSSAQSAAPQSDTAASPMIPTPASRSVDGQEASPADAAKGENTSAAPPLKDITASLEPSVASPTAVAAPATPTAAPRSGDLEPAKAPAPQTPPRPSHAPIRELPPAVEDRASPTPALISPAPQPSPASSHTPPLTAVLHEPPLASSVEPAKPSAQAASPVTPILSDEETQSAPVVIPSLTDTSESLTLEPINCPYVGVAAPVPISPSPLEASHLISAAPVPPANVLFLRVVGVTLFLFGGAFIWRRFRGRFT